MPRFRSDLYRLIGRLPVPCDDTIEWAMWYETADRRVRYTEVGPLRISTVFLGMDHNFGGDGDPLIFETMVFDDGDDSYCTRCSTWDQAEMMHEAAVEVATEHVRKANLTLNESLALAVSCISARLHELKSKES